jgi:hypothetical protein
MNIIGVNYKRQKIYNYPGSDLNYLLFFSCFNLLTSRLKQISTHVGFM